MAIHGNFKILFNDCTVINSLLKKAQSATEILADQETINGLVKEISSDTFGSICKAAFDSKQQKFKEKNIECYESGERAFRDIGEWGKVLSNDDRLIILTQIASQLEEKIHKIYNENIHPINVHPVTVYNPKSEKDDDEQIVNQMLARSNAPLPQEILAFFNKLSPKNKDALATLFYDHHKNDFINKGKDVWDCSKETLSGNPYFAEFLTAEHLFQPLKALQAQICPAPLPLEAKNDRGMGKIEIPSDVKQEENPDSQKLILMKLHIEQGKFDQFSQAFCQLTDPCKHSLAGKFYAENEELFKKKNKDHINCGFEALTGNAYYKDCVTKESLALPLDLVIAEMESLVKQVKPVKKEVQFIKPEIKAVAPANPFLELNLQEVEVISHLLSISTQEHPILIGTQPLVLDNAKTLGIRSLQDLAILDVGEAHILQVNEMIKKIKLPQINWNSVKAAIAGKDRNAMQKATSPAVSVIFDLCGILKKELSQFSKQAKERSESRGIDLSVTLEISNALLKEVEQLHKEIEDATSTVVGNWNFFQTEEKWLELEKKMNQLLSKVERLEKVRQADILTQYFSQIELNMFWKKPENTNKTLAQVALENDKNPGKIFNLNY